MRAGDGAAGMPGYFVNLHDPRAVTMSQGPSHHPPRTHAAARDGVTQSEGPEQDMPVNRIGSTILLTSP